MDVTTMIVTILTITTTTGLDTTQVRVDVLLTGRIVGLIRPGDRRPIGIITPLKQSHGLNVIIFVDRKAMINPRREDNKIPRLGMDTDPFIIHITDICCVGHTTIIET